MEGKPPRAPRAREALTLRTLLVALLIAAAPLMAQTASEDLKGFSDNSFILEEAYNQDPRVVQHISVFERDTDSDAWEFSFTEEWPLHGLKHQISYEIPVSGDGGTNLGDITINYRYQLLGDSDSDLAISPRLAVILPTGEGDSSTSFEVMLPISRVLSPRLAAHTNIGGILGKEKALELGQSIVYAPTSRAHLMLEAFYTRPESGDAELIVSPGVRWVYNRPSGLQIVPGIGVPIGVGPSSGSKSILLYLSFEHPF